ncbi:aminoglycoside phosphotransferase family protein [Streptomyces sp. CB03238]|uniref:aminoglycoside phosphotransferase family protein n=1 Tax=Streptomyces sp. CB03238 TaxID=1907777 RepID=UPI000A0FAED5|nr:aminoglycoside phosphotransferase family protein [Streptomyces sp. CB03238]ORT57251.1 hypothetical protein BKD26_25250 [Streptomyces sp. CB03238]
MADRRFPSAATLAEVLASRPGAAGKPQVIAVRDLSPGLGQAAVLGVTVEVGIGAEPENWIVKMPWWGHRSGLDARDASLGHREALFLDGDLPGRLPSGLALPADTAVVRHDEAVWIVMRDASEVLLRPWVPTSALTAARLMASLYVPGAGAACLDTEWLERDGGNAYAHHVPAGHANLDALAGDERLRHLFPGAEVDALHRLLDRADAVTALARRLPSTLVHGDFHPRNAGVADDGTMTLIDWEHVGVGPVGYDLGTFASLYRAFGGVGYLDERELLAAYATALSEVAGVDLRGHAAVGFATVLLTWGLHLRLGPGLTAVREGFLGEGPEDIAPHVEDIRLGCRRALAWAPLAE